MDILVVPSTVSLYEKGYRQNERKHIGKIVVACMFFGKQLLYLYVLSFLRFPNPILNRKRLYSKTVCIFAQLAYEEQTGSYIVREPFSHPYPSVPDSSTFTP